MKQTDMYGIISAYAKQVWNSDSWEIEITTKRDKKVTDYKLPGYYPKYRLFVTNAGALVAESEEIEGSHKDRWSAEKVVKFLLSLEAV